MKKIMALLLAAVMLLSVCGCSFFGQNEEPENPAPYSGSIPEVEGFQVGFGRSEIAPEESVPIAGVGNSTSRMSQTVHDIPYVSCFAVTDETGKTVLMCSVDIQRADKKIFDPVREILNLNTGIPIDQMFFTATHTHSAPDCRSDHHTIPAYMEKVRAAALEAAYAAIADRKPATMYFSQVETDRMNFVRHYRYIDENGEEQVFGDNYGTSTINSTTEHITEVDQTMYVVRFEREGGKDLVLANWRAHPHLFTAANSYKVSADYPGAFRDAMETLYDCYFAYFQGAAGNVNNTSRLPGEARTKDYGEFGRIMAEYALEAMQNEVKVEDTRIQNRQTIQTMERNHTQDNLVGIAYQVVAAWQSGMKMADATALGADAGIHSTYHAESIISKAQAGKDFEIELNAVTIGDKVCFVTAPCEMFDTNTMWLEENSPFELTLAFGYTNNQIGYVPSALCWEYGSYEVDTTNTVPGAAELIQEVFLKMLNEMKG